MNRNDLNSKPFPSYTRVDGFEFYVTYPGQELNRKCVEKGHFQANVIND